MNNLSLKAWIKENIEKRKSLTKIKLVFSDKEPPDEERTFIFWVDL